MYLLDTNVVSAFSRPSIDAPVASWFEGRSFDDFRVSVITLGEIHFGIARLDDGRRKAELLLWLRRWLMPTFGRHLVRFDQDMARAWGLLAARARRLGRAPEIPDMQIAATAEVLGLKIVTRNADDFTPFGFDVIDPWRSPGAGQKSFLRKD